METSQGLMSEQTDAQTDVVEGPGTGASSGLLTGLPLPLSPPDILAEPLRCILCFKLSREVTWVHMRLTAFEPCTRV